MYLKKILCSEKNLSNAMQLKLKNNNNKYFSNKLSYPSDCIN